MPIAPPPTIPVAATPAQAISSAKAPKVTIAAGAAITTTTAAAAPAKAPKRKPFLTICVFFCLSSSLYCFRA